ncbi:MAG: hypothetical protein ACI82F_003994 [Planctomycetota bacterium]
MLLDVLPQLEFATGLEQVVENLKQDVEFVFYDPSSASVYYPLNKDGQEALMERWRQGGKLRGMCGSREPGAAGSSPVVLPLESASPGRLFLLSLEGVTNAADTRVRNGTHINPLCFEATSLPRLGTSSTADVDATVQPGTNLDWIVGYAGPIAPFSASCGEIP